MNNPPFNSFRTWTKQFQVHSGGYMHCGAPQMKTNFHGLFPTVAWKLQLTKKEWGNSQEKGQFRNREKDRAGEKKKKKYHSATYQIIQFWTSCLVYGSVFCLGFYSSYIHHSSSHGHIFPNTLQIKKNKKQNLQLTTGPGGGLVQQTYSLVSAIRHSGQSNSHTHTNPPRVVHT